MNLAHCGTRREASVARMLRAGRVVGDKTQEARGLVGHGGTLGSCARCSGGYGSLRPLCGEGLIGGRSTTREAVEPLSD